MIHFIHNQKKGFIKNADTLQITFTDTYINSSIDIQKVANYQDILFSNCTFGPKAEFISITANYVRFKNCNNIPSTATINLTPITEKIYLELYKTSFSMCRFSFSENVRLLFEEENSEDNITNTYESLLSKFKNENKYVSYQNLDIIYKGQIASKSNLSYKLFNWLNKIWWNYGYSKYRVIAWTFFFLLLFFVVNVVMWNKLQIVYPLHMNEDKLAQIPKNKLKITARHYGKIFLYTAFIFFSLRIEFGNINFRSTKIVALFFLQYFIGLICLLFITSTILKI